MAQMAPAYPVTYSLEYPERLSGGLVLVKWLLAIPHFLVLVLYGIVWLVTVGIAWLVILVTGHYPRGLFNFSVSYLRYSNRVSAYLWLLRDEYPPFGGGVESSMPLTLDVQYPERLSRGKIFVKWLLVIPHMIIVTAFAYLAGAITFVAFFAVLFTGRYPRGLYDIMVAYWRWQARVNAYVYLLTDAYPPFSMD